MSIRLKIFLVITAIVAVITASSVMVSISSAQSRIIKTLETDMRLVASLANEYISGEIELLKANAAAAAQMLSIPAEELQPIMIEQLAAYGQFKAITIFNAAGKIEASYGAGTAPEELAFSSYGREAFNGRRTISTSHFDSAGRLVFYVFVPMDDHHYQMGEEDPQPKIVVCTVPGQFFSEQLNRFLIWDTGNIAMGDREGTIIANVHYEWVMERLRFIDLAERDKNYESAAQAIERMTSGWLGTDRMFLDDIEAIIAYMPVTASSEGWYLAVIAPIAESPFYSVRTVIAIAGMVFLGLGLTAAVFFSGIIARPFRQLKEHIKSSAKN